MNKMRGLQVKQSPIVKFMYDQNNLEKKLLSTLPRKISQPLIDRSINPPTNQKSYQQQSPPRNVSRGKDQIHIKIVDLPSEKRIETSSKRERKHKIFESVDKIKQKDSSQEKPKVVVNKVQIKQPIPIAQQPLPVVYAPPVIVSCNHEGGELKLANQLLNKEHQIRYLKMQVQRFKRCEKLSRQNEQIYKRLVEKITGENTQHIIQSSRKIEHEHITDRGGYTRQFPNPNRAGLEQQNDNLIKYNQEQGNPAQQIFKMSSSQKEYRHQRQSQTLPIMGISDISPILENVFDRKTIPGKYKVNEFDCQMIDGASNAITFNKQFPKEQRPRKTHKKIVRPSKWEVTNHIQFELTDLNKNLELKCKDYTLSRLIQRGNNFTNSFTQRSRSISFQSRLAVPLFF